MSREAGFPFFLWQVYDENSKKWISLSFSEVEALNKAAAKDRKKLILHSSDPVNKMTVHLDRMYAKNIRNEVKQLRCVIMTHNRKGFMLWSYVSDDNTFKCYPPRIVFFLEMMYQKKELKLEEFYYKTDYEVDFTNFTLKDKITGVIQNMHRENVDASPDEWSVSEIRQHICDLKDSESLMAAVITYKVDRIKNLLFHASVSGPEVSSSFSFSTSKNLILALEKEASIYKGKTVVDPVYNLCHQSHNVHLVSKYGDSYSACLILTNIERNINKFLIIQLIQFNSKKKFIIWRRLGRIGYDGMEETLEPFSNFNDAKKKFEKIFKEKTGNKWTERDCFERKANKYQLMSTIFSDKDVKASVRELLERLQSDLDRKIQELLMSIFRVSDLESLFKVWFLGYFTVRLGIPSARQLLASFKALDRIVTLLKNKDKGKELLEACDDYYMKMPHSTNYKAPEIIISADTIEKEVLMLEALSYICLKISRQSFVIPSIIDSAYNRLECNLIPIDYKSQEFMFLRNRVLDLNGPTHSYKIDVTNIYKWHKQSEEENFIDKGKRMLLFHGTHFSNVTGIMRHGLKLPPEGAKTTSSMFGKALYFSDVISKSAAYSLTKGVDVGIILLCEVSMGTPIEVYSGADYSTLSEAFGGVIACGEYYPSQFSETILAPEAVMPKGPLKRRVDDEHVELRYNEYAIYDERQVKVRYLMKVKFRYL